MPKRAVLSLRSGLNLQSKPTAVGWYTILMQFRKTVAGIPSFVWPLAMLSAVSVGFFVIGALENKSTEFWFLVWNLFLAWLPLVFVLWLLHVIKRYGWTSWLGIVLSILWVNFLPNSFYMVSDFIHLQDYQRVNVVFDAVTFSLFVLSGLLLGYTSLYLVHKQLARRIRQRKAWSLITIILLLCSFAIYLGRDLRMNSWDILTNPAGILFDISDPIINPRAHVLAFTTTVTFFVFLGCLYAVIWQLSRALEKQEDPHLLYTKKQ
jgi:uncharacterized membrane protein